MLSRKIVIIGDSPATYVCGIYLYTANIRPVIIRHKLPLEYECTVLPGLKMSREEYDIKCYEQASNMGLDIKDGKDVSVEIKDKFIIKYDGNAIEADILVADTSLGLPASENLYTVESRVLENEAIVVSGVGCVIAFEIKSSLN